MAPPGEMPASASAPRPAPLIERVRALGLASLPGPLPTWHADDATERARALQRLIDGARLHYERTLGIELPLTLAVLTRAQWQPLITWQPYGIPGIAGRPAVIFMPADDSGLAAEDALALQPQVAAPTLRALADAGFSYEQAARRYVDLVGLHELGHAAVHATGIHPRSRWLDELLATFFAYAYLRDRQPALAVLWEGVLQAYVDAVDPRHTRLDDFDRLYFGVGARNYVWYQAQFQRLVRQAYEAHGWRWALEVRAQFGLPSAAPLAADAVLQRLEATLPGVRAWATSFEKPAVTR